MLIWYWLLIAQIVLESFPISSSTHTALLEFFLTWSGSCAQVFSTSIATLSYTTFMHSAHMPTVIIIALFFYKRWSWLLFHWRRCWRIIIKIIVYTFIADCITALFYLLFHLYTPPASITGVGLVITALLLFSLRFCPEYPRTSWTLPRVFILGIAQGVALLPGISRLACTYTTARWLGIPWHKAVEISLLIQWPLILAASMHGLYKIGWSTLCTSFASWDMALIIVGASMLAWCGLAFVIYLMRTHKLWLFSLYMIVPLCMWLYIMMCGA